MATNLSAYASKSGTFKIGGDLEVHRMGFGAMRITGEGIWGRNSIRVVMAASVRWRSQPDFQ